MEARETRAIGLEQRLAELTLAASHLVPDGSGCAVALLPEGGTPVVACSHDWVRTLETMQTQLATGPAIHAARTTSPVVVDDWSSSEGRRWPQCWRPAMALGVRSTMSLPLDARTGVTAAVSVHAHVPNISRVPELATVDPLVSFVSGAVATALRHDRVIDQAVGIIMAKARCTPEDALVRLEDVARRCHRTPMEVATGIVRRTAGRPPESSP